MGRSIAWGFIIAIKKNRRTSILVVCSKHKVGGTCLELSFRSRHEEEDMSVASRFVLGLTKRCLILERDI